MARNHYIGRTSKASTMPKNSNNLVGWKRAELVYDKLDREILLRSTVIKDSYAKPVDTSLDSEAFCYLEDDIFLTGFPETSKHLLIYKLSYGAFKKWHTLVGKNCQCGFYAYHNQEDALAHKQNGYYGSSDVVVEVKASGKFIEYKKGLRYAHQRVQKIVVDSCTVRTCKNQAVVFVRRTPKAQDSKILLAPSCLRHAPSDTRKFMSFEEASSIASSKGRSTKFAPISVETKDGSPAWVFEKTPTNLFKKYVLDVDPIVYIVALTTGFMTLASLITFNSLLT